MAAAMQQAQQAVGGAQVQVFWYYVQLCMWVKVKYDCKILATIYLYLPDKMLHPCAGGGGAVWSSARGHLGAAWHRCHWRQEAHGHFFFSAHGHWLLKRSSYNFLIPWYQAAGFYTVESVVYAPKKKLMEIKVVKVGSQLSKQSLICNFVGCERTEGW